MVSQKQISLLGRFSVAACLTALLALIPSNGGHALTIGDGINLGAVQLGVDGGSGEMGRLGAGSSGGAGGFSLSGGDSGANGVRGQSGGTGGVGGDGGAGFWTLRDMAPGEAFINSGEVTLGGRSGLAGQQGTAGARGGNGGSGGSSLVIPLPAERGAEPNPDHDLSSLQGGAPGIFVIFLTNGGNGVEGGGGGGGAPLGIGPGAGGQGGWGLSGSQGGTGDAGQEGVDETHSTTTHLVNSGSIQVGGAGGDAGDGGDGGSGGGGGGGQGSPALLGFGGPGGHGGPAGAGGAGGSPGEPGAGTMLVGSQGRLVNEASGTIHVGRGADGGRGALHIGYGGEIVNHGAVIVDDGEISFDFGASLVNRGSIDAAGQDLTIPAQTATVVNDGDIIAASIVNEGHFSGSGRVQGDFQNKGQFGGPGRIDGNFENYNLFAPGGSLGATTIDGNYDEYWRLDIQLGRDDDSNPASSYVDVLGDVMLAGLSLLGIEFLEDFDESDLSDGDFFDVIRYTGSRVGEFSGIDDANALLGSGSWVLSYDVDLGDLSKSVRLSYIPEPSTGLLLVLGLLVMAVSREGSVK